MKKASSADCHREADNAGRGDPAGLLRRSAPRNDRGKTGIWLCALASILAIVVAYYFAFSAAHTAQIKDVPLAKPGGRP